jgi:uncharacterized protein YhbP (UPF0306 family)
MLEPEKKITDFLKKHHVLTLATSVNNETWCANCFYAYLKEETALVFTSDMGTRHIQNALVEPKVSGSVVLETSVVGKIQGIQFTGNLVLADFELLNKAKVAYLKRFPFAALMETTLWVLFLKYIKMTDNRLGFGKKLIWESEK